ncbi:hypothetical protein DXG01_001939 [Tephrocybe rancida]|nr:hypothetical protein DXG01_001939 [Tephrocybe rancida]
MACREARDHPGNEENAWHSVLWSAADKKYIPYVAEASLFLPIATLPVAAVPAPVAIPAPVAERVASPSPALVAGPSPALVPSRTPAPAAACTPAPVAGPTPAPVASPTGATAPGTPSAPIATSSAKVRTAMITPAGHPGHGPSATKKKAPGAIPVETPQVASGKVIASAKKVQQLPGDKAKGQPGKPKPNPEEDGWYIDGVHAIPCPNCVSHKQECEQHVGKDNKVGAYMGCFWAKMQCPHSMKGKGKKGEEATSDAPRKVKAKPKCKAPKSPEYMSNNDKESPAPPAPPQKPACVIMPADPIQIITEEDVTAAWCQAQAAQPRAAPLLMAPTKQKPVPSQP